MTCSTMMMYVGIELEQRLAEQGWSQDEIDLLEKEITLAREKAKAQAYRDGVSFEEQEDRMWDAEKEARQVAHDRFHAKLRDAMDDIRKLGDAKQIPLAARAHKESVH